MVYSLQSYQQFCILRSTLPCLHHTDHNFVKALKFLHFFIFRSVILITFLNCPENYRSLAVNKINSSGKIGQAILLMLILLILKVSVSWQNGIPQQSKFTFSVGNIKFFHLFPQNRKDCLLGEISAISIEPKIGQNFAAQTEGLTIFILRCPRKGSTMATQFDSLGLYFGVRVTCIEFHIQILNKNFIQRCRNLERMQFVSFSHFFETH